MPLHKVPVGLWKQLRLREGICSRLPGHYLRSQEQVRTPTPVHYRPHGVKFKINPKNGQRERVEDVPIPIYYPPESQLGLWGGEGWILGHRYVNNDKVGEQDGLGRGRGRFSGFCCPGLSALLGGGGEGGGACAYSGVQTPLHERSMLVCEAMFVADMTEPSWVSGDRVACTRNRKCRDPGWIPDQV